MKHFTVVPTKVPRIRQVLIIGWENSWLRAFESAQGLLETCSDGILGHEYREIVRRQRKHAIIKQRVVECAQRQTIAHSRRPCFRMPVNVRGLDGYRFAGSLHIEGANGTSFAVGAEHRRSEPGMPFATSGRLVGGPLLSKVILTVLLGRKSLAQVGVEPYRPENVLPIAVGEMRVQD